MMAKPRKERRGKTVYLYEPLYNKLTPTTYKEIAGMLNVEHSTVKSYGHKELFHHGLQAYVFPDKPSIKLRRQLNEEFIADDEVWRKSKIYGLKVSSLGRFKGINQNGKEQFILPHMVNGSVYVIYRNKTMNARKIVYETFIGKVKEGNQVFLKNYPKHNIGADNLVQMTSYEYNARLTSKRKSKPVVLLGENGEFIKEFRSTVHASKETYYDRTVISKVCRGHVKVPRSIGYANAFMWADDYYEKEGIC